jgi:hypothetical protein
MCEFLSENKVTVIPHPPNSPDLAPCDCFIFPELKMVLKGRRFNDITMLPRKLWVALAKFQILHFTVSGTISGLSVQSPKETTLNGARLFTRYVLLNSMLSIISHHVYCQFIMIILKAFTTGIQMKNLSQLWGDESMFAHI